jgi:hypothetical protein
MPNGHACNHSILSQMLEPVSRSLGIKTARALVSLQLAPRYQSRVEKLAGKCNQGKLTAAERSEYEAYIQGSTLIGILQAKAHRVLSKSKTA